jgi:hypothetical protein
VISRIQSRCEDFVQGCIGPAPRSVARGRMPGATRQRRGNLLAVCQTSRDCFAALAMTAIFGLVKAIAGRTGVNSWIQSRCEERQRRGNLPVIEPGPRRLLRFARNDCNRFLPGFVTAQRGEVLAMPVKVTCQYILTRESNFRIKLHFVYHNMVSDLQ